MSLPDPLDSSPAYAFIVTIDGVAIPKVIEVSGLKTEVDKIDMKQQTDDGKYVARQVIGRHKPGEFTVTRGLTDSTTISDWHKQVTQGDLGGARKTGSVALLGYESPDPIMTYEFTNCWVRSIEISGLKAGSTEQATEKFVVCYDEVTIS